MKNEKNKSALSDPRMIRQAIQDSFAKLDPRVQIKNPVMFLVYISTILTAMLTIKLSKYKPETSPDF